MISTLLGSLQKAAAHPTPASADAVDGFGPRHVPVDGCIVSPDVVIFRETSAKGYAFQAQPIKLAGVCSVAMFNMNPRVSDSPVDAPHDFETYCRQVKDKFRSVVAGAVELKADVLVCPDVGCGVFENDPHIVGTMLGEVLLELPGVVSRVVLTGKAQFAAAVQEVLAEPMLQRPMLRAPAYFTTVLADGAAAHSGVATLQEHGIFYAKTISTVGGGDSGAVGPPTVVGDARAQAQSAHAGPVNPEATSGGSSKAPPPKGKRACPGVCCGGQGVASQVDSPVPPSSSSPPRDRGVASARPAPKLSSDGDAASSSHATAGRGRPI